MERNLGYKLSPPEPAGGVPNKPGPEDGTSFPVSGVDANPLPTSLPVHVRDTQTPSLSRLESPLLG